ncbi:MULTISPECIES: carbohydrate ABC transporter permease [Streptomyces]|jgi:multiple sugar transport system permease protein|uniref:Carbohydrate ABC transporter permease n=1 Tax=Streptomyces thermoviolaceus subsp. thermoviolaceus TaxID=66860 RepID=A0ABX0YXF0_STRTL|nr:MULTISPECIES: carbohydrate ABC transporter permease [Streptomyces]WTD46554.1 carbohydrate ABC transporter permease [Streptomyces thermoviolaceus]NJP16574.1 carbohydrate ABC transporter permease [Streptomyces thermoviolaceus subsp. thermoviolaceus]RSR97615.1 carbohydrate ABC transporter permease [Streptomyces sp. WAC00469]GGV82112.1 sugar ABC transporter permease [Streptomyces thermoviolaceus subsp. apingens]GHB03609.1 sugar ABC transporter permease [Streptomyces thermoviolaceus subsp. therm
MSTRTLISPAALARPRGKAVYWTVFTVTVLLFALAFLFPVYWMVTGALKSPSEVAETPPTLVPRHWHTSAYTDAWDLMQLPQHLWNTAVQAAGAWACQLVLCTAAAYALSKLRPLFGRVVLGGILATLMVPAQALVVPTYLTVADLPLIHTSLLNDPLAIWLPAAANAFNLYLLKRFFDQIPRDVLEAAEIDGAGKLRILWSIVLPMSRPVLGVVSIFALVGVWQDFLWPLMVFSDTDKQPISVALVQLSQNIPLTVLVAAMVIASIPVVALFLVFQRHIIAGIGAGSVKG